MADTNSGFAAAQQRVSMQNRTAMRYTDMSNRFMNGGRTYPQARNNVSAVSPAVNMPEVNAADNNKSEKACAAGNNTAAHGGNMQMSGDPITAVRSFLASADTEKLIIMALIIMLASEGADMILIAALVYILMP